MLCFGGASGGLMTLRLTQLCFAALGLAIVAVALTGFSARAFTIESLSANGSGGSRFADPDNRYKNFGQGSQPFGPNGPTVQFGQGQPSLGRPFGPRPYMPPPQSYGNGNND
jgi:hypothetical protein